MKVFADFHHTDLYYSLHLLFEKRLGMELYRPIGMDWWKEGFWNVARPYGDNEDTIKQFLLEDYEPKDGTRPLNSSPKFENGEPQRTVTLKEFINMEFDVVIASHLLNIEPYFHLKNKYQPNAVLVHQMGNNWAQAINFDKVKYIMASTGKISVPAGVNVIYYHQEFDTNIFKYEPHRNDRTITNFVFPLTAQHYQEDAALWYKLREHLTDWNYYSYGNGNDDGFLQGKEKVANAMHDTTFGWHLKAAGDGYGHIIHNWFACGRPPIVKLEQYKGFLAGDLMVDGETCVAVDGLNALQIAEKILSFSRREEYKEMGRNAHKKFGEVVDFNKEAEQVKKFLEKAL